MLSSLLLDRCLEFLNEKEKKQPFYRELPLLHKYEVLKPGYSFKPDVAVADDQLIDTI